MEKSGDPDEARPFEFYPAMPPPSARDEWAMIRSMVAARPGAGADSDCSMHGSWSSIESLSRFSIGAGANSDCSMHGSWSSMESLSRFSIDESADRSDMGWLDLEPEPPVSKPTSLSYAYKAGAVYSLSGPELEKLLTSEAEPEKRLGSADKPTPTASCSGETWVDITEQPMERVRFLDRVNEDGSGSIRGENSTDEQKTSPTIKLHQIHNPRDTLFIVVSCVTDEWNERCKPHPNTLVGPECLKGVFIIKAKNPGFVSFRFHFPHLAILRTREEDVEEQLRLRKEINVDPFETGFEYRASDIDLNVVRLCFQVFLRDDKGNYTIVPPVTSHPIHHTMVSFYTSSPFGPVFSNAWETSAQFTRAGGELHLEDSEVVLEIPENSFKSPKTVTIEAAVSTDLQTVHDALGLREDESIMSPVAEFYAGDKFAFEKPVLIVLPHFLPPGCSSDEVSVYRFQKQDLKTLFCEKLKECGSLEELDSQTGVFVFTKTRQIHVLTSHFTGFLCTRCGKDSVPWPLRLRLYGRHIQRDSRDVDIWLFLGDARIDLRDFRKTVLQKKDEGHFISSLSVEPLDDELNTKFGVRLILRDREAAMWQHMEIDGRPVLPAERRISVKEFLCQCGDSSPQKVTWALHNKPDSTPSRWFYCFIEAGFCKPKGTPLEFVDESEKHILDIVGLELLNEKKTVTSQTESHEGKSHVRELENTSPPTTLAGSQSPCHETLVGGSARRTLEPRQGSSPGHPAIGDTQAAGIEAPRSYADCPENHAQHDATVTKQYRQSDAEGLSGGTSPRGRVHLSSADFPGHVCQDLEWNRAGGAPLPSQFPPTSGSPEADTAFGQNGHQGSSGHNQQILYIGKYYNYQTNNSSVSVPTNKMTSLTFNMASGLPDRRESSANVQPGHQGLEGQTGGPPPELEREMLTQEMLTTGRSPRFQTGQHSLGAQTEVPAAEHERGIPLQGILMDGCPANLEPDHPNFEARPGVPAREREIEMPLEGVSVDGCSANLQLDHSSHESRPGTPAAEPEREKNLQGILRNEYPATVQPDQQVLGLQPGEPSAEREREVPLQGMSMNECPASVQPDKHGFGAQTEAPPQEHEKELLLQEMPMNHQARMPLLREPVSSSDSATFSSLGATQADYHHTPQERKNANSRGPLIHQDFRQGTGTARLPPCSQPYEPRTEKNDFSLSSGKLGHMT